MPKWMNDIESTLRTPPTGGSGVTKDIEYNNLVKCGDDIKLGIYFYRETTGNERYGSVKKDPVLEDWQEQVDNLKEWIMELKDEIEKLKEEKLDKYNKEIILL